MTGVAIVIPMLNEAAGLPRVLRSLAALEPPPAEVLAVDGGSTDASVAIAEAAGLLVVRHETRGRAAAINRGVQEATAPISGPGRWSEPKAMTGVAIVIPMLNEAAGLPRVLRSLAALEPPPAEVLAVDGGSTDASVAIAEAAGLLVVRHETRGRAAAINRGVQKATAPIICVLRSCRACPLP
jgi:glycosyltransferase involved in cell wall biosynthesis